MRALDLFAGAGGWDVAATSLGWDVDGVEIMPEACATRAAAGLKTRWSDVRDVATSPGEYAVHIGSPPCQSFSMAGTGAGRRALDVVLAGVRLFGERRAPSFAALASLSGDERTALVLEPLRLALAGRPSFIAWEQVPTVLPVWEACADVLRDYGYSVVTGILNAEQYGVPQTRRRAVLVASREHAARLPVPTHSRFHTRDPKRLDAGVLPWVSMADALGWGMTTRPSMTVCGGGADTGGAEPFGNAARQGIRNHLESDEWLYRNGNQAHSTLRPIDQPAPNYSDGGTAGQTAAERGRSIRELEQPSVTVTSKGFQWTAERPATTVQGDARIAPPGHRDRASGEPQFGPGTIRVTVEEAATLQTFPHDFPFQGTKGKRYQQVGNAVPPLLALAILSTFA